MAERTYARVQDGTVAELFRTAEDISTMFSAELTWIDVSDVAHVAEGWLYDGTQFSPPMTPVAPAPSTPTLAELQIQLATLSAQIAALTGSH
jgi:hypothetical protein